jgi:putative oxidoreductase
MTKLNTYTELAGRVLISVIFLMAGLSKITGYAATQGYMESVGVSGSLLPLVIATEVLGAIAIIIGFKTRITAFLLAGFTVLAAYFFHNNFADQMQMIMFMKNIAISGGFLMLIANGAGALSVDAWLQRKKEA